MKARLLVKKHYPAAWVFTFKPFDVGDVVPVSPADNLPGEGQYWIDTPDLKDDAYGVLLGSGEFEIVGDDVPCSYRNMKVAK